jgi:transketolase
MKSTLFYKKKSFEIRKKLLEKFFLLKEGHPGSVFSILDVLLILYYEKFVRISKNKPLDDIIMSKGHATVGQYPILNDLGVISKKDWNNWGINQNTSLKMFGNNNIPGIKTATGSLGHGIGFGTGIAYDNQKNKKNVFVIISEGELYEGSTWEALLLLGSLKLKNVNIILDVNNNIILGDPKNCLSLGNIKNKIQSFDIFTDECNGHDFKKLNNKLTKLRKINKPTCLIVNTVKGKGFEIMENKSNWHYWNPMTNEQYLVAIEKLRINYDQ